MEKRFFKIFNEIIKIMHSKVYLSSSHVLTLILLQYVIKEN